MAGHSHRSSVKNGHKSFKSKHASKGALKRMNKGKVERENNGTGKSVKVVSRLDRKNLTNQLRQKKLLDTARIRKLFEGLHGAPKVVTVIPLTPDVDAGDIVKKLINSGDLDPSGQFSGPWNYSTPSVTNFKVDKFKTTLKLIVPDMSNFINIMDSAKVADFVVFGLSGTSEVDSVFGEQVIRVLELQGIASYMGVVANLSKVHPKEKFQLDVKQSLESYFRHFFPSEDRIYNLEKSSEATNALRVLCQKYPRAVQWRDSRGYLIADSIDFEEGVQGSGDLIVEGVVRGVGLHSNRLIHLPGLGDFMLSKIEKVASSSRASKASSDNSAVNNVFLPDQNRDTLEEFAPEDLEMEELSDNDEFEYANLSSVRYDDHGFLPGREQPMKRVKVPKGTSEYQARWYLEDVVDVDEEDDDDERRLMPEAVGEIDDEFMADVAEAQPVDPLEVNAESETLEDMHVDFPAEEEERQLRAYRELEKDDLEFPDEIELDPSESAIERLKRYRGLKSLHNCVWDADEKDPHAPPEWKRLLRLGNYKNIKRQVNKEVGAGAQVVAGDRVRIYIQFPKHLLDKIVETNLLAFTVYGLLPHEHKQAMANLSIQRWEGYEDPIPSNEPVVVQYGVRRYTIQPQFSSASNSPNNVHKYERFLHHNTVSIATCFLPLDLTQSPALYFKPDAQDPKGLQLIGHGSFLNVDHNRILAKRIILTGHPFKFHKRVITVRYMFFRPEDVEWFKSIPLFTKSGRTGFIKESLGTHGYFKATFDGKLSAQDTVAMPLFRRVWPSTSIAWQY
ncbi:small subunit rRNA maturation protein TSR1 Ecym_3275 [Eremothecium cymbalariae DBVPG|uniref:Bms1-type G domain-containing protein n=1 Tax=Eremothecium cymbalariae (strain CBS 270.75 / DBVPG 7215 / KCTC 17166 / NRRL Y-17582) TaxID=931890 RepID=G8JRJ9_ERECY|nr:Hypothetical protein Ecym_3275 [Eremothecium cymbalariae DBVPG\